MALACFAILPYFTQEKFGWLPRSHDIFASASDCLWENRAESVIALSAGIEERTRQLEEQGIPALDAAHLASAEAGDADIFLTCDDAVVRRVGRLKLGLRVMNPVAYWKQMVSHG